MSEIVPVLEFMHALSAEGIETDYAKTVADPMRYWSLVAPARREWFLRQRRADGEATDVTDVRVLRRRGRPAGAENVYVLFEFRGDATLSRAARRARDRLLYSAFAPASPEEAAETLPVPASVFTEPGVGSAGSGALRLLDRAWGGAPYDVARDGALCDLDLPSGFRETERYWLDEPFSMAVVLENDENEMVYHVQEPQLTALEQALLVTLNDRLRDVLIVGDGAPGDRAGILLHKVFDLLGKYRYRTDRRTAYKLGYLFLRNYLGLGRIEPVMRDAKVEDISCNGPGLPVFVAHARHQSVPTNLKFDEMELNSFTMKLAQRGGKLLSIAQPLVDASLPSGSRIQACLGHEVTARGSAFTIRKFREDPLTAVDLVRYGTHSLDTMALLWLAVEMRRSLIIMGATASGKTTTLNAISQFVPPTSKIVSIEDTREITLKHDNWLASVTRESFSGADGADRISMFDLLRAALRQRPDYIVVGEIRGIEGLTLFQAMSTGHTCFSTMHAGNVENAVYRLENAPINVPRVMLTSLDFFMTQGQVDVKGKPQRRMLALTEINGLDPQTRNLRVNELYRYDANSDALETVGNSAVFDQARLRAGWSRSRLEEEFAARKRVLDDLVVRNERHYSDVARAIRRFYSDRPIETTLVDEPAKPDVSIPARRLVDPASRAPKPRQEG